MGGSTLYDDLDLTCFLCVDKASILKLTNIDILQPIHSKATSNDVYTKADIDWKISSVLGAAPAVLHTCVELATALGNDSTYATTIQHQTINNSDKANTCLQTDVGVCFIYFTSCDR